MHPTPADPLIGATVSQYEIVAKLGGGGMGVVYKARDTRLGRAVALKFLPPQWSHDEGAKQRFVREAQAASATHHRNICVIHNIEETADGRLFIVMAYYEGETLKQKLERGPLPIGEAIEIASEIAEGLAKAHAQGVVHRDVKPGNLMVTDDGVKILDFGLAKFADALQLTVPGSTIGTVAYMSPEQARGDEADARSDVWALGIVMYEMLTGSVPFKGTYPEATFHAIKNEPLPSLHAARPETPDSFERIVLKALDKDPDKRFQSAREPARDLRLLAGRTVPLELRTEEVPLAALRAPLARRPWLRRAMTLRNLAVIGGVLAAAAAGSYVWTTRPVERVRVAVVPVANHTGNTELDQYRLALTAMLIDEISESPNIRVVPYLRLVEMIRPFMTKAGDISSNDAVHAIASDSGAPFLVVPILEYRDRDAAWFVQIQVRNAATGTTTASYDTAPVTSSLPQQTAFRLVTAAAEDIQQHFKQNGPGRAFQPRAISSRFREPEAARRFAEGMAKYDELEYAAALSALSEAATLDDQRALTHAWLSRVYLILSRRNEAVAAAQRAKALATTETSKADRTFVDAVLAESQGEMDGAEKAYRELVAIEPDDPAARVELADFLKRRQDRNQAAIDAYHDLLGIDPTYTRPHIDLCQLYTRIDDHAFAEKEAQLALTRYHELAIASGEAQGLLCLGEAQREQGGVHLADARRNADAARNLIAPLDEPYNLSRAVFYQGLVEYSDGQLRQAARIFEEAAAKTHEVGNRVSEGLALMNLAVVDQLLGRPTLAVDLYRQSREVFLSIGNERRVAEADVNSTAVEIDFSSRPDDALKRLANAKVNLEKLGYVDFQLVAMKSEADSLRYAGRIVESRRLLQSALEIATEKQLTSKIAELTVALAQTELDAGNYVTARDRLKPLFEGGKAGDEESHIALGTVLTRMGDFNAARAHLEPALASVEARQLSGLLPLVHSALGELAYQSGKAAEARSHFTAAVVSWTDPLLNPASIQAQCYRGGQDVVTKRPGARNDLETAVAQATRTGRLAVEAQCRAQLAQVDVEDKRFADALAVLKPLPDDTAERMIGSELRAKVEFWRGQAMAGLGEVDGASHRDEAREHLRALRDSLPQELRPSFATRPDIAAILLPRSVRSQP